MFASQVKYFKFQNRHYTRMKGYTYGNGNEMKSAYG